MRNFVISKENISYRTSELDAYLNNIRKYKELSIEEEKKLFKAVRNGNNTAKEKLINSHLLFVVSVAKKYQGLGLDILDIINEGNIGLCKAVDKFDETTDNKFISFAVYYIRAEILHALDYDSRLVRLPQKAKAVSTSISFETPLGSDDDGDKTLIDTFASDSKANNYDKDYDISVKIAYALSKVSKKEKDIICALFGIGQNEQSEYTLSKKYGVTEERIRQIKWEAISKMKNA